MAKYCNKKLPSNIKYAPIIHIQNSLKKHWRGGGGGEGAGEEILCYTGGPVEIMSLFCLDFFAVLTDKHEQS